MGFFSNLFKGKKKEEEQSNVEVESSQAPQEPVEEAVTTETVVVAEQVEEPELESDVGVEEVKVDTFDIPADEPDTRVETEETTEKPVEFEVQTLEVPAVEEAISIEKPVEVANEPEKKIEVEPEIEIDLGK